MAVVSAWTDASNLFRRKLICNSMDGDCCNVENNKWSKLRLSGATEEYSRRSRTISLGGRYCQAADEITGHLILVREDDHNY